MSIAKKAPARKAPTKKAPAKKRSPMRSVRKSPKEAAKAAGPKPPAAPAVLLGHHLRHLRALAHDLEPVVLVGKESLSEGLLLATRRALLDHELIKVRLPQLEKGERQQMAEALATGTQSALVQSIGRVAVLYRTHPTKPKILFPR